MTDKEFEQWEKDVEAQKVKNNKLIDGFKIWLQQKKLAARTIEGHIMNIELFGNHYLLYEEVIPLEDGYEEMDYFLSNWHNRKVIASKGAIKKNISTLKKFYTYTYLHEIKAMNDGDFADMILLIKTTKADWIESEEAYFNQDWDW